MTGHFKTFDASVETQGEDFSTARIHFSADLDSITTNNEQRDGHLKTADFFDAQNHPKITFEGNKLEKLSDEQYKLHGHFTIRGVSKPVVLDVEYGGIAKDPWGNTRAGFAVNGKINRKDFGINFGAVTETGGLVVSDDVKLHGNVEFVKQA